MPASLSAIAIACFLDLTFFLEPPLFNLPGNFRFSANPQAGGIMYNLGFGA